MLRNQHDQGAPDFDEFVASFGVFVWHKLYPARHSRFHFYVECPQKIAPVGFAQDWENSRCADCTELWGDVMVMLWSKLRHEVAKVGQIDVERFINVAFANALIDWDRKRRVERGGIAHPARAVRGKTVVASLPDPTDRALLEAMLYHAPSNDPGGRDGYPFPLERWAAEFQEPVAAVNGRLNRIIGTLRGAFPGFVEDYIDRPLSQRLATHADLFIELMAAELGEHDQPDDGPFTPDSDGVGRLTA